MSDDQFRKSRRRLIRFSNRIIARCDLTIAEGEAWSRLRPEERPLDIEPERIIRSYAMKILHAARAGRYIDPAWSHAIIASALDGEA